MDRLFDQNLSFSKDQEQYGTKNDPNRQVTASQPNFDDLEVNHPYEVDPWALSTDQQDEANFPLLPSSEYNDWMKDKLDFLIPTDDQIREWSDPNASQDFWDLEPNLQVSGNHVPVGMQKSVSVNPGYIDPALFAPWPDQHAHVQSTTEATSLFSGLQDVQVHESKLPDIHTESRVDHQYQTADGDPHSLPQYQGPIQLGQGTPVEQPKPIEPLAHGQKRTRSRKDPASPENEPAQKKTKAQPTPGSRQGSDHRWDECPFTHSLQLPLMDMTDVELLVFFPKLISHRRKMLWRIMHNHKEIWGSSKMVKVIELHRAEQRRNLGNTWTRAILRVGKILDDHCDLDGAWRLGHYRKLVAEGKVQRPAFTLKVNEFANPDNKSVTRSDDPLLRDLSINVTRWPQNRDAGMLTKAVQFCCAGPHREFRLSQIDVVINQFTGRGHGVQDASAHGDLMQRTPSAAQFRAQRMHQGLQQQTLAPATSVVQHPYSQQNFDHEHHQTQHASSTFPRQYCYNPQQQAYTFRQPESSYEHFNTTGADPIQRPGRPYQDQQNQVALYEWVGRNLIDGWGQQQQDQKNKRMGER